MPSGTGAALNEQGILVHQPIVVVVKAMRVAMWC